MALPGVNPTYRYLDDNAPDGTILGQNASALVGFFGATPTSQRSSASQAAPSTTASASVSATQWGFSTSTQADALVTCVRQLRSELVTLGLIKGS